MTGRCRLERMFINKKKIQLNAEKEKTGNLQLLLLRWQKLNEFIFELNLNQQVTSESLVFTFDGSRNNLMSHDKSHEI